MRKEPERGLPLEVAAVWLLFLAVLVEIVVTYWREPPSELYHVSGSGLEGAASRALVFLNFPTALVVIALLAILAERLSRAWATAVAVTGLVLSAAVLWPGVVDEADLDAKPVNAIAALGVLAGAALTLVAWTGRGKISRIGRRRGDPARALVAAAVLVLALPWIAADAGFSFSGVPVLGTLYQTGELRSQPGNPELHPAVHLGHHHGMDGALLVLTALLLSRLLPSMSRQWVRGAVGAYLALMLAYGIGEVANDFWLEQVVKRGWTDWEIPDVTKPTLSVAWALIVLGAAAIYAVGAWRHAPQRPIPRW